MIDDIVRPYVRTSVLYHLRLNQELMSGEAAEERVTTAYTLVPSKSELLANEIPNKETTLQIKRHGDDIKPTCSVIAM